MSILMGCPCKMGFVCTENVRGTKQTVCNIGVSIKRVSVQRGLTVLRYPWDKLLSSR